MCIRDRFSHPADFTPVCTIEFIGFAKAADTFKAMNCELLGLSIDSVFSHLASRVLAAGAGFRLLSPRRTMLASSKPIVLSLIHI